MTANIVLRQREYFYTDKTKPTEFRIHQLKKMKSLILQYEERIIEALSSDLGSHPLKGYTREVGLIIKDINFAIKKLKIWIKPITVGRKFFTVTKSKLYYEPFGVSLIISSSKNPFLPSLRPLIASIAAGNCSTLVFRSQTPHTTNLMLEIINQHFAEEFLFAVECEPKEIVELSKSGYDFIFHPGFFASGKNIIKKAAESLSPVLLSERSMRLILVDETANIMYAAKRIVWGKYINSAQDALVPAYLYVHISLKNEFIKAIKHHLGKYYGPDPLLHPDYGKINELQFKQLIEWMGKSNILLGGNKDEVNFKIEPTLIEANLTEDSLFFEENFGPVLPIQTYKDLEILIANLKKLPRLQSLYHFSKHKPSINKVNHSITFCAGYVNDCQLHSSCKDSPFIGDAASFGSIVGVLGFKTFSHAKCISERRKIPFSDLSILPVFVNMKAFYRRKLRRLNAFYAHHRAKAIQKLVKLRSSLGVSGF